MTMHATIAHGVQQIQQWLKELIENGGLESEREAYAVLRAVLHQLRDRLTLEEAVDLGAQLPLIVRGIYFEGWRPSRVPAKVRTCREFLDELVMSCCRIGCRPRPPHATCSRCSRTTATRARLRT
jgi:uncharacterized protein (DUF2267 family)